MNPIFSNRWIVALRYSICLLALSACQLSQLATQPVEVPVTPGATAEVTAGLPAGSTPEATGEANQFTVEFGPGPFNLGNPTTGLPDLSSYTATLKLSFKGTWAGQPGQWSRTYVMLASREPASRQITVDTTGLDLAPVFMAEVNGASYELDKENNCIASTLEANRSLAATWEPAGFLSAVIGAEAAASETINGVATNHYTFDQRALGEAGFTQSTGEVWVASENGYLVRYLLTSTGGADYFGEGTEGTFNVEYNLTAINQPVSINLPASCPAVLVDVPVMTGAQIVRQLPGVTTFSTAGTIPEVLTFYQAQLPQLGWAASGDPTLTDTSGLAVFVQGDRQIIVLMRASESGTDVRLVAGTMVPPAAP